MVPPQATVDLHARPVGGLHVICPAHTPLRDCTPCRGVAIDRQEEGDACRLWIGSMLKITKDADQLPRRNF